MGPQQTSTPNLAPQAPPTSSHSCIQPQPPSGKNKALIWVLIVFGILLASAIVFMVLEPAKSPQSEGKNNTQTEALFYDTLHNASKQPVFRLGMYRAGYTNNTDA